MPSIDFWNLEPFLLVCLILAAAMLIWNTVEVGRNDAANLVNAVLGARVLARRTAIALAGVAVVSGAYLSSLNPNHSDQDIKLYNMMDWLK